MANAIGEAEADEFLLPTLSSTLSIRYKTVVKQLNTFSYVALELPMLLCVLILQVILKPFCINEKASN